MLRSADGRPLVLTGAVRQSEVAIPLPLTPHPQMLARDLVDRAGDGEVAVGLLLERRHVEPSRRVSVSALGGGAIAGRLRVFAGQQAARQRTLGDG